MNLNILVYTAVGQSIPLQYFTLILCVKNAKVQKEGQMAAFLQGEEWW